MKFKRCLLIIFILVFVISFITSANYNMTSVVVSEGGINATSANYQTDIVVNTISNNITSALYKLFMGFWYSFLDTTPPIIIWELPTPADDDTIDYDSVYLNTTITDDSNTSAWFDWNKSLVGYWAMDFYNASGIYDNSTHCYDNETEILTENGWKLFKNLKDEKVATLNQASGELEWQKPTDYPIFDYDKDMFRIVLEDESDLLVSEEHKVYSSSKNLFSSLVLNTESSDCSLKCLSLDQMGILRSSANAKNGTSFSSEINCDAFNLDSSDGEMNSMILGRSSNFCSNSFLVISDLEQMVSEYFLSSFNNALGENNSTEYEFINSAVYDSALNNDKTTLVSITNFILAQDLEDSSMLSFNFFPNSRQSLSESLDFSNPSLNSSNASSCFILLANASLAIEDQLSHSNLSILCLNSFGTDNVNDGIFISYTYNMCDMYDNTCQVYKDFGLEQIIETYKKFENRGEIYFLDSENNPVKVKSIVKEDYSGKIYDVDVENDVVLVRRKNGKAVWSGNSNFGTFAGGLGTDNITTGKYGDGLVFDGVGDYLDVHNGSFPFLKTTPFSGTAWIKTSSSANQAIITNWQILTSAGWEFSLNEFGSGVIAMVLTNAVGTNYEGQAGSTTVNDDKWHFVVFTYDGSNTPQGIKLFVDGGGESLTEKSLGSKDPGTLIDGSFEIGRRRYAASAEYFNGIIDEVKIFNRALSAEEINASYNNGLYRLYHNFTDLDNGAYNYSAYAIDSAGNLNITSERVININANVAPNNPSPELVSVDGTNKTNSDLNCSALITDDDSGDTLDVTVQWFKNDVLNLTLDYNNSYSNATMFSAILESGNTSKTENWTCGLRVYDGSEYSDWVNASDLEILNTLPVVTLISPANYNVTTNRTPEFSWSGTDADEDSLTYQVNVSLVADDSSLCFDAERDDDGISANSYIANPYLVCLKDYNDYYNWSVRASDDAGDTYGEWADYRKIEIQSEVIISLPVNKINFGSLGMDATNNTEDNSPPPFEIQNDGNCFLNISLNATDLWTSIFGNSSYYQFKFDNHPSETGSFNWVQTQTDWSSVPNSTQIVMVELNWSDANDSAEMDLLVTVPPQESAGDRSSILHFTAELGE